MPPISLPPEVDTTSRVPRVALAHDTTSGVKQVADRARRMAIVGQKLAAGTQAVNTPIEITRETDGEALFGAGSMLDIAIKAAFKAFRYVRLVAVAMADGGGAVAASQTVTYANNATADGAALLWIRGRRILAAIAKNNTPTQIATAVAAAVNAVADLGVTATSAIGVVTLTAVNKGTMGNGIKLRAQMSLDTATIGTTVVLGGATLAAGATDPDPTTALASLAGERYHEISLLLSDATSGGKGKDHVTDQGAAEVGRGEHCHQAINNTLSTSTTLSAALNAPRNTVCSINGSESWEVEIVAAFAAVLSSETDPTRPLNWLVLAGILPPPVEKRWIRTEQKSLLDAGCTPLIVNASGEVCIQRAVSTRVKNAANNADYTLFDITIMRGLDAVRDDVVLMFQTNYARSKWANDSADSLLPPDVATPDKVEADVIAVLRADERRGIVQRVSELAADVVAEKVGTQCQISIPADIVDGLHEILGKTVLIRQDVAA